MTYTVEAVFENGVLKPTKDLPLLEQEHVQLIIRTFQCHADRTYGMIGWLGDAASFDRLLEESDAERLELAE